MNLSHHAIRFDMTRSEFVWFSFVMLMFLAVIAMVGLRLFVPELFVTDVESGADFGAGSIVALASSAFGLFFLTRG